MAVFFVRGCGRETTHGSLVNNTWYGVRVLGVHHGTAPWLSPNMVHNGDFHTVGYTMIHTMKGIYMS